ncbi:unnamed protein product [Boreogadus saida]
MVGDHSCSACMAPLQIEDGHDLCPSCLGLGHLKEGLSDDPCMNCTFMPRAVRVARLAEVEQRLGLVSSPELLPPAQRRNPAQDGRSKRRAAVTAGPTSRKKVRESGLASKVGQLTAELESMKCLFLAFQAGTGAGGPGALAPPAATLEPEEDVLSLAASAAEFAEYEPDGVLQDVASRASAACSRPSTHSSTSASEDNSMGAIIRMALASLQLDVPQAQPAPASAFFRRGSAPASFTVPPSEEYLRELHACWRDPTCRVTDDLLSKAYDAAARMGRIGNSMSHLMLALSASLQEVAVGALAHDFSDASLQAFALMSRELGRVMSTLVQARRQVCAAITHRLTPVATLGLSAHVHSLLSSRHRPFGPLSGCPRGSLRSHMLPAVPPGPLEVGGPGAEGQGPVVGCFSQQQLSYWAASTRDPWVLSTLTHGYKLQFRRRPPAYGRVKMTIIHDPAKAQALTQELSALLDKVAMKACPSPQRVDGILRLLLLFREGRLLRYVEFLRLLGKLTAAATVVPLGLLSLRPLQRWLHSFHLDVRWHRHRGLKGPTRC